MKDKKKISILFIGIIIFITIILSMFNGNNNPNQENNLKQIKVSEVTRSVFYAPQ